MRRQSTSRTLLLSVSDVHCQYPSAVAVVVAVCIRDALRRLANQYVMTDKTKVDITKE
jgi:hypothetical protein